MAPALKFADLKARLSTGGTLPPLILLLGPERFFKEEALEFIAKNLQKKSGGDLNRISVDATSSDLEALPATQLSPSLFGGEKLILIRGFDKVRAADRKTFLRTLAECHLAPSIHVVLLSEDMRSAPADLKGCSHQAYLFYVPWKSELIAWIAQRLTARNVTCSRTVLDLLYRLHGKTVPWKTDLEVDVFALAGSVDRLARHATATGGGSVSESDVEQVLGRVAPPDVFHLVDLAGQRRRPQVVRATRVFLQDSGENAIGLVALLLARFEKLIQLRAAATESRRGVWEKTLRQAQEIDRAVRFPQRRAAMANLAEHLESTGGELARVASELKEYQRSALIQQADRYELTDLKRHFGDLVRIDALLKSGGGDDRAEVEGFMARL